MYVRLIMYEPRTILTLCHDVCTRMPITAYYYVTVPEPPRSRSSITLMRCNVGGYASNTTLPSYASASPVLTLC